MIQMSSIEHDSSIIKTFADKRYRSAAWLEVKYALVFGIVGVMILLYLTPASSHFIPVSCVGVIVGGLLGYNYGAQKAFSLRLQAQTALCFTKIEENTRK
jgi:hypothetical protein